MKLSEMSIEQLQKIAKSKYLIQNVEDMEREEILDAIKDAKQKTENAAAEVTQIKSKNIEKEKSAEERISDFVKSIYTAEKEIEPLKEHIRDIKKSYHDNGWITRKEQRLIIKAFRMIKNNDDIKELEGFYNKVSKQIRK